MDPTNPFDSLSAFGSLAPPPLNLRPGGAVPAAPQQLQQQQQPGFSYGNYFGMLGNMLNQQLQPRPTQWLPNILNGPPAGMLRGF